MVMFMRLNFGQCQESYTNCVKTLNMFLEGHSHIYDFIDDFDYGRFSKRDRLFKDEYLVIQRGGALLNRNISFGATSLDFYSLI